MTRLQACYKLYTEFCIEYLALSQTDISTCSRYKIPVCNILKNDQVRLRNENAEIESEIDELKSKIAKYTTMWNNLPKNVKTQVNYCVLYCIGIRFSIKYISKYVWYRSPVETKSTFINQIPSILCTKFWLKVLDVKLVQ